MKYQYNFLKPLDHATNSNSSNKSAGEQRGIGGKLSSLVASSNKFTASSTNQQSEKQHSRDAKKLISPRMSSSSSPAQAELASGGKTNNMQANTAKTNTRLESHDMSKAKAIAGTHKAPVTQQLASQQQQASTARAIQLARPSGAEFSARKLMRQVEAMANSQKHSTAASSSSSSNVITPELAKCYDEIDQIYDYIRGLAPLPLRLRKIKSIDFEQIEREQRIKPQQQAFSQRSCAQVTANMLQPQLAEQNDKRRSAKLRQQRDGSPPPPPPLQQQTRRAVQRALPIKVLVTSVAMEQKQPTVKRVEGLNLGGNQSQRQLSSAAAKPAYLIGSSQRGQPSFRLPRANSTSTLAKPGESRKTNTGTLPAAAMLRPHVDSLPRSLGRLRTRLFNLDPSVNHKSLDLVESFVDDDDDDEDETIEKQPSDDRSMTSAPEKATTSDNSEAASKQISDSASSNTSSSSSATSATTNSSSQDSSSASSRGRSNEKKISSASEKGSQKVSSAEKSHSDYENDSASISEDDSSSDTSSSGSSSTSSDAASGSLSSFSGRPGSQDRRHWGRRTSAEGGKEAEEEHIYEQIPAHKSKPAGDNSLQQTKQQLFMQATNWPSRAQRLQQPFNYPIAYAPNVAAVEHQSDQARSRLHQQQQRQQLMRQRLMPVSREPMIARHPRPLGANDPRPRSAHEKYHKMVTPAPNYHSQAARLLDHRYRLSMGNLHMMAPHMAQHQQQMGSLQRRQPMAPETAAIDYVNAKLSRSSSSSKVNRLSRGPQLSPTQLLAQNQVPRAVSKRQQQQMLVVDDRPVIGGTTSYPSPRQQRNLFVWHQQRAGGPNPAASSRNRNSVRRLTAIGIEDAMGFARLHNESQQKAHQFVQDSGNNSLKMRASAYFEPVQLMGAPLIDDDSSEVDSPSLRKSSREANPSKQDASKQSSKQTPRLNSISDLHSFSSSPSSSSADGTNPAAGSTASDQNEETQTEEPASDTKQKPAGNFVSSRSFIKCYYGKPTSVGAPRTVKAAAVKSPALSAAPKATAGRKLLNLIGLDTASAGKSANANPEKKPTSRPSASKRTNQSGSIFVDVLPRTPAKQQPIKTTTSADLIKQSKMSSRALEGPLVGEFLNAEGPILVRDRRLAANFKSELVRHYQHPTVQVSKVPAKVEHESSLTVSSTSSSTSSYEAAMKNTSELPEALIHPRVEETKQEKVAYKKSSPSAAAGNQGTLIKVPKLSKQSHLLQRPLPRPPAPVSSSGEVGRRMSHPATAIAHSASSGNPIRLSRQTNAGGGSTGQASGRHHGKQAVSANTDATIAAPVKPKQSKFSLDGPTRQVAGHRSSNGRQSASTGNSHGRNSTAGLTKSPSNGGGNQNGHQQTALTVSLSGNLAQPSPTVTTYTSSGISSRLTAATHLASNFSTGGGGNNRSLSSSTGSSSQITGGGRRQAAVTTSGAELAKRLSDSRNKATLPSSSPLGSKSFPADDFELMDDDDDDNDGGADDESAMSMEREQQVSKQASGGFSRDRQQEASGKLAASGEEQQLMNSSNLKLFDECFSSKFTDRHLASSDDSLLDSINFSGTGTLNRKSSGGTPTSGGAPANCRDRRKSDLAIQ